MGHGIHRFVTLLLKKPSTQVHLAAPTVDLLFRGQEEQVDDPAVEKVFEGHSDFTPAPLQM
jgi:hypothetical protein